MSWHFGNFLLTLSLLGLAACADFPAPAPLHSLDYLEFQAPNGWTLRIDSDGSGRLKCREYPGRVVHYLPATFPLKQLPQQFRDCSSQFQVASPACLRAVYYQERGNKTAICYCPEDLWVQAYFATAYAEIDQSSGAQRDRRLIKRFWLIEPPLPMVIPHSTALRW